MLVNNDITAPTVRLIHVDGVNEVMTIAEAKKVAMAQELDLLQMNDQEVPVVKLIDFAQHMYAIKQAEKLQKKKQRASTIVVKEIQLNLGIQDHDAKIKQKNIRKFLDNGDQVRISLRLAGRARGNHNMQQLAKDKVDIFIQGIGQFTMLSPVTLSGDSITVTVKAKAL